MFSDRLKELRKSKGLTQTSLADKINCSVSKIAMWETNKREPVKEDLILLSNFFNVSVDYLLEISDNPYLNEKDEKSIEKDLKIIMDDFKSGESGPAFYDGVELDNDDLDKLEIAMRTALEIAKVKNKEKYTPKKYKKDKE